MKNVTGYDVARGLAGSWGTLAVMTEVTFKVLPLAGDGGDRWSSRAAGRSGVELLCAAMAQPFEVSGAVHLQAPVAARLNHPGLKAMNKSVTALRLENFASARRLPQAAAQGGAQGLRRGARARPRELAGVLGRAAPPVGDAATGRRCCGASPPRRRRRRSSSPPSSATCRRKPSTTGRAASIWLEVPATADAGAAEIRRVIAMHGGHATLIRAEPNVRAAVEVFQPLSPAVER